MSEDIRLFLFAYAKDGEVKVLSHDEACVNEIRMKQDGWKHTATITAREWIQHIVNSPEYSGPNGQALPKAVHSTACGNAVLGHVLSLSNQTQKHDNRTTTEGCRVLG